MFNAPAQARLLGWIRFRLRVSRTTWIHLDPATFCNATGLSRRSFFYAKKILSMQKGVGITFRTVVLAPERGWKILVSFTPTLIYKQTACGRNRRVKSSVRGTECNSYIRNTTYSRKLTPRYAAFGLSPPQIRLAHRVKRDLADLHWDNCKVRYSPGMAYNYARDLIALSHDVSEIVRYYDIWLHHFHGVATDNGVHFAPSSTVNRARRAARLEADGNRVSGASPGESGA